MIKWARMICRQDFLYVLVVKVYFQQSRSIIKKNDLSIMNKILHWYRSMLFHSFEGKFLRFLRQILNPFCLNQLWSRKILIDIESHDQQIVNDLFLDLCCSINHSICLQQISNKNDPQVLLQFIFNNQQIGSIFVLLI